MGPPIWEGRRTQWMRSFRGSYGNRGNGAKLRPSDARPTGFERPRPPSLAASGNSPCPRPVPRFARNASGGLNLLRTWSSWVLQAPAIPQKVTPRGVTFCGTADGIRTHDLQSRSLALYPAELRPHVHPYLQGGRNLLYCQEEKQPRTRSSTAARGIIANFFPKVKAEFSFFQNDEKGLYPT